MEQVFAGRYAQTAGEATDVGWLGGERVFWSVHDPERAIVMYRNDVPYAGLVLEVAGPAYEVRPISAAVWQRAHR